MNVDIMAVREALLSAVEPNLGEPYDIRGRRPL